ncbi:hypothetical protein DSL06_03200, partial [Mycobacterium tuberculosis]
PNIEPTRESCASLIADPPNQPAAADTINNGQVSRRLRSPGPATLPGNNDARPSPARPHENLPHLRGMSATAVAVPFAGTRRCSATEKCCGNWLPQPSAGGQRATLPRKALCSSHIRGHRC